MFIQYAHNMRHTFAYPVVAGIPNIGSRSTQGRALNSARQWRLRQAISSRTWCFPCWEPSPLHGTGKYNLQHSYLLDADIYVYDIHHV